MQVNLSKITISIILIYIANGRFFARMSGSILTLEVSSDYKNDPKMLVHY